ncbi:MAG: SIMPL domain-containing protein [Cyclobacteriaceae bacterium]|nr:SIMPL domain-containing protein [Cyclobacteriaceae bacterium]
MRLNITYILIALILSVGIILAGNLVGKMHLNGLKYQRYVSVKGLAEREVDANLAIWPFRMTIASNDLNLLQKKLENDSRIILNFLSEEGFDSEFSTGVAEIQDSQTFNYGSPNQSNSLRYIARKDFTIRTPDIPKLHRALGNISSLIGKGIVLESKNQWQGVEYLFTDLNEIKPGMIEEATKNAREAAQKFAQDAGSKVGKIKSANQGLFTISDRDINTGYIKNVRIVNTIDFYLED